MAYSKSIYEVAGQEIFRKAMTGEQCAKLFERLDCSAPNIHEMADCIQSATGNDRYACMLQVIESTGVRAPYGSCRMPIKDDSPEYIFDNGNVRKRGRGW